ncbi:hypothetical protein FSP39_017416 [Pinctada imbricata]|uniref:Polycystin cation channel PKD1/PKD2 domain-containing protein n=1 Tax=Pinctada imbricata TaxID=66713 RepID=A0AA88XKM5_PINIB|nr:hypothetical protein FSP39_017416 [Pinctada imbricata]
MSLTAIGCYIGRIDRTIFIVEEIFNSADQFMSFEIVQLLDDIYKGCIGVVLFISILQLLQPLSFNYYIYVMKASIAISKQDLGSFGFFTAIPLAAFASLTFCTLSHQSYSFRDLPSSFLSLFRTMLAMVRFQDIFESDDAFDMIVFTIFIFTMAIILVNIFVCILNDSFAYIREKGGNLTETEPFDTDLNEHFWWKVNQALNVCSKGKNDDTGANYSSDEHRRSFQQNMMQLDQMVITLFFLHFEG